MTSQPAARCELWPRRSWPACRLLAGPTASSTSCGARLHDHGIDLRILVEPSGLSCGDLVFAGESAEDLFSSDAVLGEVDLRWPGVSLVRCELAEGAVWPGGVVVQQVFGQDLPQ